MEKIGRRELCAADFRFDPENRVQIGTGSILGQIDPVPLPGSAKRGVVVLGTVVFQIKESLNRIKI